MLKKVNKSAMECQNGEILVLKQYDLPTSMILYFNHQLQGKSVDGKSNWQFFFFKPIFLKNRKHGCSECFEEVLSYDIARLWKYWVVFKFTVKTCEKQAA